MNTATQKYDLAVSSPSSHRVEKLKRLTLDLPADLHRQLKIRSAETGVPMAEMLRAMVAREIDRPVKRHG